MKLANLNPKSAAERGAARQKRGISTLLALFMIFSLAVLGIQPVSAQTGDAPLAPDASWTIRTVEDPPYFTDMTDRSMRFDGGGIPHIAFGGDHLYYARWYSNTDRRWMVKTVDSGLDVGRYASLALDSSGNPRIAYYDAANGDLKFAYSNNGGYNWIAPMTVATLGPQPVAGPDTIEYALAQQAAQRVQPDSKGIYGFQESPDAVLETGVGGYTSIATDAQNRVHLSYYDWNQGKLMYASWDGVTWTIQTVDGDPSTGLDVGKFSSIAIDGNGYPHISYMDEKYEDLRYAYMTGSGWEIRELKSVDLDHRTPNFKFGGFSSLALDSDGNPFISNQDWQNANLMIASPAIGGSCTGSNCWVCGPGGSWQCRVVDNTDSTGWYSSIAIDSEDTLMISYYDASDGDLMLATSDNGRNWSKEELYTAGDAGLYTSIAINGSDNPGVSYYTASNGLLSFIRWTGDAWENSGIIYTGDLIPLSSLTITPYNTPFISYFNDTADQLKLASAAGGVWSAQALINGGSGFSSVKITSGGDPRIAYYDVSTASLMYAYRTASKWYFATIDSTGDVGQYPSLALDSLDRPYISYYDETNKALKFAYYNGSAWVVGFAEISDSYVGTYNSLTLGTGVNCYTVLTGSSVCPMISYYDATHMVLKLAFRSVINSWASIVVDNVGNVGMYSSIDLDNANGLHISYYDSTNHILKHAAGTQNGSAWTFPVIEVVDNVGNVGQYSSVAVDAANNVHISYYDATLGHLKYALKSGGGWSTQVVDSSQNTGQGSSLALFFNGQPGISYFDTKSGALKFATQYTGLMGKPVYLPIMHK